MSISVELAEKIKSIDMFELACKVIAPKMNLTEDETSIVSELDAHFKEIGKNGNDPQHEVAAFIQKVVNHELEEANDELLSRLFDRNTIGAFDDYENAAEPVNKLIAYEAAHGGNVPRSFIDTTILTPTWKNRQIDTDISYADLERGGFKTVARATDYALAEMKKNMFKDVFAALDNGFSSGDANYISVGAATMSATAADKLSLFCHDRADKGEGNIVGRSVFIQQMSKLTGFVSDDIVNEVHRNGCLGMYDGVAMTPVSAATKTGDGTVLFPDKTVFACAGKIGSLTLKGDVKVYQTMDNNGEKVVLKFANFTYGWAFNKSVLDNVAVAKLS